MNKKHDTIIEMEGGFLIVYSLPEMELWFDFVLDENNKNARAATRENSCLSGDIVRRSDEDRSALFYLKCFNIGYQGRGLACFPGHGRVTWETPFWCIQATFIYLCYSFSYAYDLYDE